MVPAEKRPIMLQSHRNPTHQTERPSKPEATLFQEWLMGVLADQHAP